MNFIPVSIMFFITVFVAAALMLPVTLLRERKGVVGFYWKGFWFFLALIAGLSGASSMLMMLGLEKIDISNQVLTFVIMCQIIFIFIGWCHIVFYSLTRFIDKRRS